MNGWEALLAATVATIFAISAVSKAFDRAALVPILRGLGLPAPMAAAVDVIIVPLEAFVAVGLLTGLPAAPAVAAVIATGFVLTQLAARLQGVSGDCRCFGSLAPTRAGTAPAIARAALLLGASTALALTGPVSALVDPALIGLGLALGTATVLGFGLLESVRRFEREREQVAAQAVLRIRPLSKED